MHARDSRITLHDGSGKWLLRAQRKHSPKISSMSGPPPIPPIPPMPGCSLPYRSYAARWSGSLKISYAAPISWKRALAASSLPGFLSGWFASDALRYAAFSSLGDASGAQLSRSYSSVSATMARDGLASKERREGVGRQRCAQDVPKTAA